jgi:hypothetical protein
MGMPEVRRDKEMKKTKAFLFNEEGETIQELEATRFWCTSERPTPLLDITIDNFPAPTVHLSIQVPIRSIRHEATIALKRVGRKSGAKK